MLATEYFLNLNFLCNERCVFCAADLGARDDQANPRFQLHLDDVRRWVGNDLPGQHDRVLFAGGEPTLNRELVSIARFLSRNCANVTIFTNGLRLANPEFARQAVEAGINHFEIALFGASAARHDAVTQVTGSFERTLGALNVLSTLRSQCRFQVEVRLLVSRQSFAENPKIVQLLHERVEVIDAVSINRLILSTDAKTSDAPVSWAEARASINSAAELIIESGYELKFESLPLCVFEGDVAAYVRKRITQKNDRVAAGSEPSHWEFRYLDPEVRSEFRDKGSSRVRPVLPDFCLSCVYLPNCALIEPWYVRRYGFAGLQAIQGQ